MNSAELKKLLEDKSSRVTFKKLTGTNGNFFNRVLIDRTETSFAVCIKCYEGEKFSTFTMSGNSVASGQFERHLKLCGGKETLKKEVSMKAFMNKQPTTTAKYEMAELLAKFCAKTSSSFRNMASEESIKMFQSFVELLNCYGNNLDVRTLMPDRRTIGEHVKLLADKIDSTKMEEILIKFGGAISIDFGHNVHDYFVQISHYIDNNWNLKTDLIGCEAVSGTKSEDDVVFFVQNALQRFDLSLLVGISDEGGNVRNTTENLFGHAVSCTAHVLNTVCKHIFSPYVRKDLVEKIPTHLKLDDDEIVVIEKADELLKGVKRFAGYAHSISFTNCSKVVISVETRFLSQLPCIKSVKKLLDEVALPELKAKVKAPTAVQTLNKLRLQTEEMECIIKVLEIFEPMFDHLEGEKMVTSNRVLIVYHKIKIALELLLGNEQLMTRVLAKSALAALSVKKDHFYNDVWIFAQALDPWTKHFNMIFTPSEKQNVIEKLQMNCLPDEISNDVPQKRVRLDVNTMFGGNPESNVEMTEVEKYYCLESTQEDPLEFWKRNELQYPHLAKFARKILSVPATSASAERAFSLIGNLVAEKRTSLNPTTVCDCLKLRYNVN